jgi:tungstate transport system substrate-binding protein
LSDRSTWLAYGDKKQHRIVFEGDPPLFNQYGIIPVSPNRCPDTNVSAAIRVTEWLLSEKGQDIISRYQVAGQQLFFPNAR